jgi:8-oxo-dGTP diphosphatase
MNYPELHNRRRPFVGTTGLIYFGDAFVLSYTRDGNTRSYPYHRDLAGGARDNNESPFGTFRRELDEEFGLGIAPDQIIYTRQYPGLVEPAKIGYFVVGVLPESEIENISFGDEGLTHHVTSLHNLVTDPMLIPRRKDQIETYLASTSLAHAI